MVILILILLINDKDEHLLMQLVDIYILIFKVSLQVFAHIYRVIYHI